MLILTVALVLLGLGWNFGLISGTALVVDSTFASPTANRIEKKTICSTSFCAAASKKLCGTVCSRTLVTVGVYLLLERSLTSESTYEYLRGFAAQPLVKLIILALACTGVVFLVGAKLLDAGVDKEYRGREKASDHAPTWVRLES